LVDEVDLALLAAARQGVHALGKAGGAGLEARVEGLEAREVVPRGDDDRARDERDDESDDAEDDVGLNRQ
jgi:hypothetical protein